MKVKLKDLPDQFAVSYFSTSLIVLIQIYNWKIWHHSLVCCWGLADITYVLNFIKKENEIFKTNAD